VADWHPKSLWKSWWESGDEHGSGGGANSTEGDIPEVQIDDASTPWELKLAQFCLLVAQLLTCAVVCSARAAIRRRDRIAPGPCCSDCCEDVCCALCCNPCSQCLILRHEGVTSGKYSLCSPIAVNV